MNNVIKSLFPQKCPHCQKDLLVETQTIPPVVSSILKLEDVAEAKKQVKNKALEILHGDDLSAALEWLDNEDTVFGPDDVQSIIDGFKK